MKRKLITLTLMLIASMFLVTELKAQSDGFFTTSKGLREPTSDGLQGFNFGNFTTQQNGLDFENFTGGNAPIANGMFIMAGASLIYLINKRRKENEK